MNLSRVFSWPTLWRSIVKIDGISQDCAMVKHALASQTQFKLRWWLPGKMACQLDKVCPLFFCQRALITLHGPQVIHHWSVSLVACSFKTILLRHLGLNCQKLSIDEPYNLRRRLPFGWFQADLVHPNTFCQTDHLNVSLSVGHGLASVAWRCEHHSGWLRQEWHTEMIRLCPKYISINGAAWRVKHLRERVQFAPNQLQVNHPELHRKPIKCTCVL